METEKKLQSSSSLTRSGIENENETVGRSSSSEQKSDCAEEGSEKSARGKMAATAAAAAAKGLDERETEGRYRLLTTGGNYCRWKERKRVKGLTLAAKPLSHSQYSSYIYIQQREMNTQLDNRVYS